MKNFIIIVLVLVFSFVNLSIADDTLNMKLHETKYLKNVKHSNGNIQTQVLKVETGWIYTQIYRISGSSAVSIASVYVRDPNYWPEN